MKKLIKKYLTLPFEEKTLFNTLFLIIFNGFMAIIKILMGCFTSMYLFALASGGMNIFLMFSKIQVYLGLKHPEKKSFSYRNKMMGLFLIFAAIFYIVMMIRPLLFNIASDAYEEFLAIGIAFVSFVEVGVSIAGCFSAFGKGHYYRNIKLINLCSAFTALVLTETALMSFAYQGDSTILNCAFGIGVGVIIILIAIYILIAPKISIVERKKNVYKLIPNEKPIDFSINEQEFVYQLTHSKFYGNYVYIGKINGNIVDGIIIKQKLDKQNQV